MAQAKLGSAGVTAREIDLSGPTTVEPSGVPAGVIGTALKGPAFVPVTVGVIDDFYGRFGKTDGKKFGPLAAVEWLRDASSLTYLRVLGAGDGKRRLTSTSAAGSVNTAGWTVGEQEPDTSTGLLVTNPYANSGGPLGRTYFLGCFMSESAGSDVFSSAGLQGTGSVTPNVISAVPIIRGILMAPSGVIVRLSSSLAPSTAPASTLVPTDASAKGGMLGDVILTENSINKQEFVILLNGHKGTDSKYPNVITASFDMTAPNYFANVLNKDPLSIQTAGHYLYVNYDVHPSTAVLTGTVLVSAGASHPAAIRSGLETSAFLLSSSVARNTGTSTVPNFENFNDRYRAARSPWVISQKFGGTAHNLFRINSIDDGEGSAQNYKISIENIAPSTDPANLYGTFDLLVRDIDDRDTDQIVLEAWRGLSLDPSSDRYIAKVIGDLNVYFDWDRTESSQKLTVDGNYANRSTFIRVEMDSTVDNGLLDPTALPMGFRGIAHLVTSGSDPMSPSGTVSLTTVAAYKRLVQPPVPMRTDICVGTNQKRNVNSSLYWGVRFEHVTSLSTPNASSMQNSTVVNGLSRYLPDFMTAIQNTVVSDNAGVADTAANGILDADRFNRNLFTLENVQVVTSSTTYADPTKWDQAVYVRPGAIVTNDSAKTRALTVSDLTIANRKYAKFTFFMQGGFDGVNIFDAEEAKLSNTAVVADMNDSNRGLNLGPNVVAYSKAINIMKSTTDVDIQLLAVPGIRHSIVTDAAALAVKDRFDSLYLMDIDSYDNLNSLVTGSAQVDHIGNTVTAFKNRALDNSFAAAYYPDVVVKDPNTNTNVIVPPSVVVLGAFALNDRLAHPWFAAAGFTRGALQSTLEAKVKLYKENMDQLYEAGVNPLVAFPGGGGSVNGSSGVVVWGQKTLQAAASALDRVNVRRLLISIRRETREVGNSIIFEPNRETTLQKFSNAMKPRLQRIQAQKGVDKFLVKIDTSTTTQLDVENNTIRGKIFVVPTKTVEFVSLDFVVTNKGREGL